MPNDPETRMEETLEAYEQLIRQGKVLANGSRTAWLIARPGVTAPIASATSLDQLTDLMEATKLALDPSSIAFLDTASA